jgi:hypothetical protein
VNPNLRILATCLLAGAAPWLIVVAVVCKQACRHNEPVRLAIPVTPGVTDLHYELSEVIASGRDTRRVSSSSEAPGHRQIRITGITQMSASAHRRVGRRSAVWALGVVARSTLFGGTGCFADDQAAALPAVATPWTTSRPS